MKSLVLYLTISLCCLFPFAQTNAAVEISTSETEIVEIIKKVNYYWQNNSKSKWSFWDEAAYHTGNMEAYCTTGIEDFRRYSEAWAEKNEWKGAKSDDKSRWKYHYGETNDFVLFGDWQICFQTYIDLYNLDPDPKKIARAKEVMEHEMSTPNSDYWWWADGLYMVMPVMTKLYKLTGDTLYLNKLYEYYLYADSVMYDKEEGLYYRDAKYIYPKHKSTNGLKDFWARGDGWVFAGLAKVLKDLPGNNPNRSFFVGRYKKMAEAIIAAQQKEGYWTRSMLDPEHAPGPETSGTAFFTYGLFWGINNGYLNKEEYMPAAAKAWNYLINTALQANGKIGYVQPIGEKAIPGQVVDANSTANFGVGAFLLAACELLKMKGYYTSFNPGQLWLDNNGEHINAHGGGVICHDGKYYWFGEHKGAKSNNALVGVTCYSSDDLYRWKNEGIALSVDEDPQSEIVKGCIIERPKVIYNKKTKKFVMYFHLELKGKGYSAAHVGIAVSDHATGPYKYIRSCRPNAGSWPLNMSKAERKDTTSVDSFEDWWTPQWTKAVKSGLFVRRDFQGGQMSRDMTLFVDDNGKAYHIFSSEENLTIHIAELSDDYLSHTGKYIRVEPAGHNEAPAIFKKDGKYYMITSGCTGWDPNAARLMTADKILGNWTLHPNPCIGKGSDLTFGGQSTYILPVNGKKDAFIFMADQWRPRRPIDGRYLWLPITFENGLPVLKWADQWQLDVFN